MSKRQKFVVATLVLLAGIVLSRLFPGLLLQWRWRVGIVGLLSLAASVWALRDEDFAGIEWVTLPILPVFFTVAATAVLPLLPSGFDLVSILPVSSDASQILGLMVRLAHLGVFVVGYYAALLTANIYNVAAIRTIQLLRVAHSIGFLVTVATALFFYIVLASLHLSSFLNFLLVFSVSFPLAFQAIWSVNLEEKMSSETRNFSLLTAVVLAQIAWILSFWPVGVSIFALFLTAIFYELVGIIQYHFGERLSTKIANEFVLVAIAMLLVVIFTTRWGA